MKKFILAVAVVLAATTARAEILATMPNQTGGRIELLDVTVPDGVQTLSGCAHTLIAKTWDNRSEDTWGCWRVENDTVVINWLMNNRTIERTYLSGAFSMTETGKRLSANK